MGRSSEQGLSRRDLLEWLGRGAGLALFSPLIQACSSASRALGGKDALAPGDTFTDQGPSVDAPAPDVAACGDADFRPGPDDVPVAGEWGERTVDKQDITSILANWTLTVDGLADRPRTFTFCDLRDLGLVRQVTDFHCVEGWSIWDVPWDGVPLATVLDLVGAKPEATWLKFTSVGGTYTESLAVPVAREPHALLGLGIGGQTLPLKHGFPCRVVVPRLYGYKNAKYVERIELVTTETVGFWPSYGYTTSGEVDPSRLRPGHT